MRIFGQNTQENHFIILSFQINSKDVRSTKTIRIGICEEKQKGYLAVSSLCQCSKRIIIEMALVFNVFSFEIRRQLLKLILFEQSRRFVGGGTTSNASEAHGHWYKSVKRGRAIGPQRRYPYVILNDTNRI